MNIETGSRNRVRVVMWEMTRACRLACMHCVVGAQQRRSSLELSTYEAYKLIDQVAALGPDEFIMTGGDPLEREDVFQLIDYSVRRRVPPTITLSATPALNGAAIARLRRSGLASIAFSIDAPVPDRHDAIRGITGQFAATLLGTRWARTSGLQLEVNTLLNRKTMGELPTIASLLGELGIRRWNVFFFVPVGDQRAAQMLSGAEAEAACAELYAIARKVPFAIRTFEAPQYGRLIVQKGLEDRQQTLDRFFASADGEDTALEKSATDRALIDRSEVLFVSHTGEVTVSPFLPLTAGNVRYQALSTIHRSSDLLVALRDGRNLKGRCGRCEYKSMCGGSRSRAFATTGDVFASDPFCTYEPGRLAESTPMLARDGR
jgi:radical SAM protein with 4Fe4S-binding SPASM domain